MTFTGFCTFQVEHVTIGGPQDANSGTHLDGQVFEENKMLTLQGTNISLQKWHFEDDFPFPQVGYNNPLEGKGLAPNSVLFFFVAQHCRCLLDLLFTGILLHTQHVI